MRWLREKLRSYMDDKIMNDPEKFRKCFELAYGKASEVKMVKGECEKLAISNSILIDSDIKASHARVEGNMFVSGAIVLKNFRRPQALQQRLYLASQKVKRRT